MINNFPAKEDTEQRGNEAVAINIDLSLDRSMGRNVVLMSIFSSITAG